MVYFLTVQYSLLSHPSISPEKKCICRYTLHVDLDPLTQAQDFNYSNVLPQLSTWNLLILIIHSLGSPGQPLAICSGQEADFQSDAKQKRVTGQGARKIL